jgi:hypothetical protein
MAVFQFQAPDADMDRWKAEAARRSVSFAEYIRSLLNSNGSQVPNGPEERMVSVPESPRQLPADPSRPPVGLPKAPSGKRSFKPDPK